MVAPLIKLGLPALVNGLAELFKNVPHPAAQGASAALESVGAVLTQGKIPPEQLGEMNRHYEKLEEMASGERETIITQVNESLRAEVGSADPYVRRMRPTFGYLIALTWTAQMLAIAYVIAFETGQAGVVIDAMASLGTIWAVGLSVLGIYVYQRSEEKKRKI
ncbi:MAG: 3TM-type holin [Pseudomonadota bacterium]